MSNVWVCNGYETKIRPLNPPIAFENMNTPTSIHAHSSRRLLLMVPVIYSIAFAACSDLAGTARAHVTGTLQSPVMRAPQTREIVTVGPTTYNSEAKSFERGMGIWSGI